MDQMTRDDIAAAAAAHRELGPEYEQGVAESLVERIGAEVDRRVDARLAQAGYPSRRPARASRGNFSAVLLALGSMGLGVGASALVLNASTHVGASAVTTAVSGGQVFLVLVIWLVIGAINVSFRRR
ncbi:MAG: hypothetical protein ACLP7J_07545 [Streptosporangiaceae bacterium]